MGTEGITDGGEIHHRLYGVDEIWETSFDGNAVNVDKARFLTGQLGDRIEDDEARSVGDEIGEDLAANLKPRASVRMANDFDRIPKFLRGTHFRGACDA